MLKDSEWNENRAEREHSGNLAASRAINNKRGMDATCANFLIGIKITKSLEAAFWLYP
jgi:hypothetical protein